MKYYIDIVKQNPLRFLLVTTISSQLLLFLFYGNVTIYPDSEDYIQLGQRLSNFDLANYEGKRTIGYPLLFVLSFNNLKILILLQLLIGILNTKILYDLSLSLSQNKFIAFLSTFTTITFIHYRFYEFAILTESLALSLLLFIFWFINKYQILKLKGSTGHLFLLSILLSWIYLTRPVFIYLSLSLVFFIILKNYKTYFLKSLIHSAFLIMLPVLAYLGWNLLNLSNIDKFTNTPYTGINLIQTVTPFIEKADSKDYAITSIIERKRDSLLKTSPDREAMSVWFAYNDLIKTTQLTELDLFDRLGKIAKETIKKEPILYLKQVLRNSLLFWTTKDSLKWNYDKFENRYFKYILAGIWNYIQRYLLIIINVLFLIFSISSLSKFIKNRLFSFDLFLIFIVWMGTLTQAVIAYGSNSRFAFPFLPLIIYFVFLNLTKPLNLYKSKFIKIFQ